MSGTSRILRQAGPIATIDRALGGCRASLSELALPAWAGGALPAAALLGVYYLERVEGISSLRLPLALLVVLAFAGRALLVSGASARAARVLWDGARDEAGARGEEPRARGADVVRTSMVVALGLWVWSWLFVAASLGGPFGALLALPVLALRGAVAPSWLARSRLEPGAGWRAFARAVGDSSGRRFDGVIIEACMLAAGVGLTLNLYALLAIALLLARSFLGLELASVESFLSPGNTFVVLTVAAAAFVSLEPVRASLSALVYVDARVRAEGLDLRTEIDEAIARAEPRATSSRLDRGARAALALAVLLGASAQAPDPAHAQEPAHLTSGAGDASEGDASAETDQAEPSRSLIGDIPLAAPTPEDLRASERAKAILQRAEFRELTDRRGEGLRVLLEQLLQWLLRPRDDPPRFEAPALPGLALPGAWFFVAVGVLLLAAVGAYLWRTRAREHAAVRAREALVSGDPRDRAPAAFLDDASRLAETGELREALRALYLATLVALDRRRLIAFDAHRTNWQYLRQMPRGSARDAFGGFTRIFDHKWYGQEATSLADYERCSALARAIVDDSASEAAR